MLRVETRRRVLAVRLGGHPLIRSGERIGVLHLDNARVAALHEDGRPPMAVGLEFRRLLIESLGALAAEARDGQRLAGLSAFTAVTIFHHGLRRLGFETQRDGLVWPRVTALYQRALLGSLHPNGALRRHRPPSAGAERLWISRDRLLALYGGTCVRRYAGSPGR